MRVFALLVTGLLSACAANVPTDYKVDPQKPLGLVVGSITFESSMGSYRVVVVPVKDGPVAPEEVKVLKAGDAQWTPFTRFYDDDLKGKGDTFAVEMPAGNYRIRAWHVVQGAKRSSSTNPIDIPFTVEPGKAIYVGAFNWDSHWVNITLRDQSSRDIPILEKRFPGLKAAPIAMGIAPGTVLEKLGGDYRYRVDMPIFVPVAR